MKKLFVILSISLISGSCFSQVKTQVIAHRGFWNCEGSAQNSIFSLKKTQEIKIYGSEFDVLVTPDGVAVVNHDDKIDGLLIENTPYGQLKDKTISNGEKLPTLESYLKQGKKDKKTKLILEIKPHSTKEKEDQAVELITRMVKKQKLENQVEYISFSMNICKEIIRINPKAQVAYLRGDLSPQEIKNIGLTGIDYNYKVFQTKKNWISEAKQLGLTVNIWTVNDPVIMKELIDQQVDFITTDKPLELQAIL